MVVAVGRRNQKGGVGTEQLSFKEIMLTAIISFCMGHETLSGYYTKVPARQKTHVQTQHRNDRQHHEGEDVAVVAVCPLMTLAAFILVQSVSRAPSTIPSPSLACAGGHLQQLWDLAGTHTFTCSSSASGPQLRLRQPPATAAPAAAATALRCRFGGAGPKRRGMPSTTVRGSGSHARTSLSCCFHIQSSKAPRKATAQHPEQDRAAHTMSFAPH